MVLNPSSLDRLTHVLLGAFLAGSFLVLSVHAWYIWKGRFVEISKKAFRMALLVVTVAAVAQLFSGHRSAKYVAEYQPAKLAAFEGHYDSLAVGDLFLFGTTDPQTQRTPWGRHSQAAQFSGARGL